MPPGVVAAGALLQLLVVIVRAGAASLRRRMPSATAEIAGVAPAPSAALDALIGTSPVMTALRRRVTRLLPTRVPVLIEGETGTGKELLARAIHEDGPRRGAPFVPVNCGALAPDLVDAELFGHERGAFTGALGRRRGRAAEADGGTLFLDEIGELPPASQCKLLRLLQGGEVQRIGSDRPTAVDVRIVAATNRNLRDLVARGEFRADCYHRLAGFPVTVPPLRTRGDDVLALAAHLLERFSHELGRTTLRLASDAAPVLRGHCWPGNVRELENVIRELVVYTDAPVVRGADVRAALGARAGAAPDDVPRALSASSLAGLLTRHAGNVSRAAHALGISRPTFYKRLREHGVEWTRFRAAAPPIGTSP